MFIQTEPTPNPATVKFLPGRDVMGDGTADFPDAVSAARSPLATRLFGVTGVAGVFLGGDFISVVKADGTEWPAMKPQILAAIMDHYSSGDPVVLELEGGDSGAQDSAIVAQIKELLETRIRPALAQDGGDVVFRGFENGVVLLHLRGACSGCPSAGATLKHGIENLLRHYIPEVTGVRAVA